jgi:membrane protease subunit HflK
MAWNEPGGKRRDPWQGGDDKPDLDATLKRVKERFGRLAGGNGGGSGAWLLIAGIVLAWFAFDSWAKVDESQRGVVLRFGKSDRVMNPGLNLKWPRPIEDVTVVDTTRVRSHSDQVRMLTKDENLVIVDFNVQYSVSDPYRFVFSVRDPEETLRQAAESAVRQVIGGSNMEDVISEKRSKLMEDAKAIVQGLLDERYQTGLVVSQLTFPNLQPPAEVKDAFDDAIAAREDKQRVQNEAEAYAQKVVPEARGEAARIRAEAEGERAAAIAVAQGAAQRFTLLAAQYRAAPEVTRKRLLLETMQYVLSGSPKVLVEGGGDKVLYLPLDQIGGAPLPPIISQPSSGERVMSVAPAIESTRSRDSDRTGREGRDR